MNDGDTGHCLRCAGPRQVEFPHTRMRRLAKVYVWLWLIAVPVLPIMAADYVVALPSFMLYLMGMGPALKLIKGPPTCVDCGAYVPVRRPLAVTKL